MNIQKLNDIMMQLDQVTTQLKSYGEGTPNKKALPENVIGNIRGLLSLVKSYNTSMGDIQVSSNVPRGMAESIGDFLAALEFFQGNGKSKTTQEKVNNVQVALFSDITQEVRRLNKKLNLKDLKLGQRVERSERSKEF